MAGAPAVAFVLAAWNLAGGPAFSGVDARPAAAAQAVAASRASAAPLSGWRPFVQDTVNRVSVDASPGAPWSLHMVVRRVAGRPEGWHASAAVAGESLAPLRPAAEYVLRFRARASRPRTISLDLAQAPGPYRNLGLLRDLAVDATPRDYAVGFRTADSLPPPPPAGPGIRLTIGAGRERGEVWLGRVAIEPAAPQRFEGAPLSIESFAPGAWSGGELDSLHARNGQPGLALAVPENGGLLATCETPLDLSAGGWDLSLSVYTDTPQCIGRIIVLARSGSDPTRAFTFWSFSGLEAGWNQIFVPRERFVSYGWLGRFSWAEVRTIGIKLESNGNGPARATVAQLGLVPHGRGEPSAFVSFVTVDSVASAAARVHWETSSARRCELDFGLTPAYGKRWVEVGGAATEHVAKLRGLEPGRTYHARVRGVGLTLASGDFTFVTDPAHPWIAGGDSVSFDLGLYSVSDVADLERARRTAFNCFSSYHFCADSDTAVARYLDVAVASGAGAIVGFCPPNVVRGDLAPVLRRVRRLAEHPGLRGWYLYDEPEGDRTDPAALKVAYDAIHREDAAHPVMIASYQLGPTYPYRDAFDIALVDQYPVPYAPVDSIVPTLERARASGKPFEFVFQAYSSELQRWPGTFPGPGRYPSRDEMRAMAYLAIVHGAAGLWTFAYSYLQDTPGSEWHWTELLSLARELRLLGPLLASPLGGGVRATSSASAVHACVKKYGGAAYLIAVNASPAPTRALIRLEGQVPLTARELFSGLAAPVRGGEITGEWPAYAVRIYRLATG